jgi:predicted 2-oxoglutarate/Fe(II)-dependent dioxygenase YbiX
LDIDKVPNIINIIINSFQYIIIENIQNSYCLKDNESYHIDKIFIIKNDTSTVSEFFCEKSAISINIMLNSKYEGGNLNFDDNLVTKLDIGDMIIYSSNTNHTYLPITSGLQYILVGLINIYEKSIKSL